MPGIKFSRYLQIWNNRFIWIEESRDDRRYNEIGREEVVKEHFYLYAKKEKMIPDEEFQNENVKKEVNEFGERED